MEHETAGDPMTGLKWTHRTTAKIADELRALGIDVCPQTVARLLKAMAARGKSEAYTRRIGLSALHLMPWPWASDRRRGGRRRCG